MIRFCVIKLIVLSLGLSSATSTSNSFRTKRQYQSQNIGSTLLTTIAPFYDTKHVPLFNKLTLYNEQIQTTNSIADKFQINKNSIIRTHDSRTLGANYINETDLPSNNDCLMWCWNTTNCNLAVYEEKTRGSCYLFDCGSLDDFKCRFTPHGFYSSSVLQVNRNSYFLNEWKSQANQENELAGLKDRQQLQGPPGSLKQSKSAPNEVIKDLDKPSGMLATKSPVITATIKTSKCRHYQFECRNNSECIAIYNVCDGIPQCSDASDESVELECHKARLNPIKSHSETQSDKSKLEAATSLNKPKPVSMQASSYANSIYTSNNAKLPTKDSNSNDPNKILAYPLNYFNYNYPRTSNDKLAEENTSNGNRAATQFVNGDYNSYGLAWNQLPTPNEAYNKQVGNYIANTQDQDPYSAALKEPAYWPSFNYPHNSDQMQPIQQYPLPQQLDAKYNLPISLVDNRNHQPEYKLSQQQLSPAYRNYLENLVPQAAKSMLPTMAVPAINNATLLKDSIQVSKSIVARPSQTLAKSVNNSSKNEYSYISNSQKKVPISGPNVAAVSYLQDTTSQSGRETNSAVIALTLGLFVTSILIVIVGCRMKTFKKRISRRGRSLAHDADYLINGMYL